MNLSSPMVRSSGTTYFVDRKAPEASEELIALGLYKAVLAAADSAEDQVVIRGSWPPWEVALFC